MSKSLLLFLVSVYVLNAADWLMLQGSEKKSSHKLWGFIQVKQENNYGDIQEVSGFNKTPYSYIKPTLKRQSELQISRLRLGLRGSLDDANKINYFLLTEFAQNGVNNPLNYYNPTYLVDASLTFKYLPVLVRLGKFKYAGSEEGQMARFASPFINFTTVSNQLLLERFVDKNGVPIQGVGAYRDTGVQFFNSIKLTDNKVLTLSYMLANGSGTANKNINDNKFTHYTYVAYENILGKGKGYKQESYKVYAWAQNGKRVYDYTLYNRNRYGIGATYIHNKLRIEAEYMFGNGMILNGVKDINPAQGQEDWVYKMQADEENKANGAYMLSTYELFNPLTLIARYDIYNRITNDDNLYRKFESFTTGFSYAFEKYNRIDINYAFNSIKAPYNQSAQSLLQSTVGNLLSIQLTWVIK